MNKISPISGTFFNKRKNKNKEEKVMTTQGQLIVEGKTKNIFVDEDEAALCIIENKTAITKNDNPEETQEFNTKAKACTVTTSHMFQILTDVGIPVAFRKQLSDTKFLAEKTVMIPLEVIGRRFVLDGSSYLKRVPSCAVEKGQPAHRFDDLCIEFFLKTTEEKCVINTNNGPVTLIDELKVEDPFIFNPDEDEWKLCHPKKPYSDEESFLSLFNPTTLLGSGTISIKEIRSITKQVYEVLEAAWWYKAKCRLADFKIEFGITADGRLVVSDVIDNDSWRLLDENLEDLSKQSFRDGEPMSDVERKYLQVMEMSYNLV